MKIVNNKNLRYTKIPGGSFGPKDSFEADVGKMILISFKRSNKQTLFFDLKTETNNKNAYIRANNVAGEKDLDILEKKLNDFIEKSYEEILYTEY